MKVSVAYLGVVFSAVLLAACESDGHITSIVPTTIFLPHDENSPYPNINSVPITGDPRLQELSQQDKRIPEWRDVLERKQQALDEYNPPKKREYDDPEWLGDE